MPTAGGWSHLTLGTHLHFATSNFLICHVPGSFWHLFVYARHPNACTAMTLHAPQCTQGGQVRTSVPEMGRPLYDF